MDRLSLGIARRRTDTIALAFDFHTPRANDGERPYKNRKPSERSTPAQTLSMLAREQTNALNKHVASGTFCRPYYPYRSSGGNPPCVC